MTLVRHRLLTPEGAPIAGQKVTAVLMGRDDLADDSYSINAPDNSSFAGGELYRRVPAISGSDGWLQWQLTPNEFIVPDGTYYQILGLGRNRTILWVPDDDAPIELTECRLNLVDFNDSNLVIVQGPRGRSGEATVTDAAVAAHLPARLTDTALRAASVAAVQAAITAGTITVGSGITVSTDPGGATLLTVG